MELYIKVISLGQGVAYNRKRKSNTYGWSRLLVVLHSTPGPGDRERKTEQDE